MPEPTVSRAGAAIVASLALCLLSTAQASHEDGAALTVRQEAREGEECAVLLVELDDASEETIRFGVFQSGEGSAPDTELVGGEANATPDEESGGFDLTLGPYDQEDLDGRTTDLYVGVAWGEPGEHRLLSEHFDIACGDEPPAGPPSNAQPPVCVDSLMATAGSDGVLLDWDAVVANEEELDHYSVRRVEASAWDGVEPGEEIARTLATEHLDDTAEAGVTYRYTVFAEGEVSTSCGSVEVTAVPFFGAPLLAALAGAGAVGAYALARRR